MTMRSLLPAEDKLLHFYCGALIAFFGNKLGVPTYSMLLIVASIAVLKECYDAYLNYRAVKQGLLPPHEVSPWDIFATYFGAYVVLM